VSELKLQNLRMHITGVTGHRDLDDADRPGLERAVHACMDDIEALYSKRKYCLASGLAAGADQLVAQCALDRKWELHAVIASSPSDSLVATMPDLEAHVLDASIKSFASTMSENEAHKLQNYFLPRCNEVIILSPNSMDEIAGYVAVATELVESADSLIALWDGAPGRGAGGTAYTLTSFLEASTTIIHQLEAERTVYWVRTRRSGELLYSVAPEWKKIQLKNLTI